MMTITNVPRRQFWHPSWRDQCHEFCRSVHVPTAKSVLCDSNCFSIQFIRSCQKTKFTSMLIIKGRKQKINQQSIDVKNVQKQSLKKRKKRNKNKKRLKTLDKKRLSPIRNA